MYKTTDLWFAAYLKHDGVPLHDFEYKERGRVVYIFKLEADQVKKYRMSFLNSDISKIKQQIEELKDLAY